MRGRVTQAHTPCARVLLAPHEEQRPEHPPEARVETRYKLAHDDRDTRAPRPYLENIQHTVRYTEFALDRFRSFCRDLPLVEFLYTAGTRTR